MTADDVLRFWFLETSAEKHWAKVPAFDEEVRRRFGELLRSAERGELFPWRKSARGRLAEIIILDQFSRNIYRGSPQAFQNDPVALVLAQELVFLGLDEELPLEERRFAYLPFMHSESLVIHEEALKLFSVPGLEDGLKYEKLHHEVLLKFGRYPHRNNVLGRVSAPEETQFLSQHPGF